MDKEIMEYIHNRVLFSHKEGNDVIFRKMELEIIMLSELTKFKKTNTSCRI
jgi:hypothetical protein